MTDNQDTPSHKIGGGGLEGNGVSWQWKVEFQLSFKSLIRDTKKFIAFQLHQTCIARQKSVGGLLSGIFAKYVRTSAVISICDTSTCLVLSYK